jgi:hypothetical protein
VTTARKTHSPTRAGGKRLCVASAALAGCGSQDFAESSLTSTSQTTTPVISAA